MKMTGYLMALAVVALWATGCQSAEKQQPLVKPHALASGDTIAFVATAGWRPPEVLDKAEAALRERGYNVKRADNLGDRYGYLTGSDEARAAGLMQAFADPEVDLVLPVTGGYGTNRVLDLLDWEVIRANPKIVMGYSDVTALHLALESRGRMVSFHSPFLTWVYGGDQAAAEMTEDLLLRAIEGARYGTGEEGYLIDGMRAELKPRALVPGVARGRLTGGNLSLVASLMGTPYEIDTRGALLFLEDVGEEPYRVDRMLSTLKLGGKLDEASGIIVGVFKGCEPEEPERSLTLETLFEEYFADLGVPVVLDFPVGHVRENATLPVGVMAELDAGAGTVRLLENPVELRRAD